jgi:uncharacterized protein (TIGR00255 family)
MTGFGEAVRQDGQLSATVEIRAVNNRYLKINTRCSEGWPVLDPQIEAAVRRRIKRGTVQVNVRLRQTSGGGQYQLNEDVLNAYRAQLEKIHQRWHRTDTVSVDSLLMLPGVVEDEERVGDAANVWPVVEAALTESLDNLDSMRQAEGQAMTADLFQNLGQIQQQLRHIQQRAPLVVQSYRDRLTERLNQLLAEHDAQVQPVDIVREVGVFADRSDIAEECVRLQSHIEQFRETLDSPDSSGRRLEFLTQEMFRETNTIGSKANDAEISRHVIEIKTAIERIREMVQNVE